MDASNESTCALSPTHLSMQQLPPAALGLRWIHRGERTGNDEQRAGNNSSPTASYLVRSDWGGSKFNNFTTSAIQEEVSRSSQKEKKGKDWEEKEKLPLLLNHSRLQQNPFN